MKHNPKAAISIAAALSLAHPSAALADGTWTVLLGVGAGLGYYEGDDTEVNPFPYISYEIDGLQVGLGGISYTLPGSEVLQVSFGVSPRFAPDFPDTDLFDGLDRDMTVEATISATYQLDAGLSASVGFRHDLLGEHGGYVLEASGARSFAAGPAFVTMSAGARHRDDDLNAYLIGVSNAEASALRQAYAPGSTTTPFGGLSVTLPVAENLAVLGNAEFEYLGDSYRDSPLVERRFSSSVSLGLAYSF
ncbi:MipA/OmpV family protein [Gymnodinialimonas sp. 2305UL16-5]|uniref:MipA/OmpV family protein n=1 Tax=Gymnodinialimonas mytili TaxID=3126503 RepID=UPI00309CB680